MKPQPELFLEHFLFVEDPFAVPPDPCFLFRSKAHEEALAALELGIATRRGLVVMVGEVGTGKTTLARAIVESSGPDTHVAYISSSTLGFRDLLIEALRQWEVKAVSGSKGQLIATLRDFASACDERDEIVALIVDEAQALSDSVFEELRQLLNLETSKRKLIQLILVGQPELHDKLAKRKLRHVADRIAMRSYIQPLSRREAHDYVEHRLGLVGSSSVVFRPRALRALIRASRGTPRTLNVLCHNALLRAYGRGLPQVDAECAKLAIREKKGRRVWRMGAGWLAIPATVLLATLGLVLIGEPEAGREPSSDLGAARSTETRPPVEAAIRESTRANAAPLVPSSPKPGETATGDLLVVEVLPGSTMSDLVFQVYGRYTAELLAEVVSVNPDLASVDQLIPGQQISFPDPPSGVRGPIFP